MTTMPHRFDLLVFIGRFQPFHNGHLEVVEKARASADRVLILVGSANRPRSIRDPFTFAERRQMIRDCFDSTSADGLLIEPLEDALYNDARWVANVQRQVRAAASAAYPDRDFKSLRIGLIGHSKDQTSYYLRLFPHWGAIDVPNHEGLSATAIRAQFLAEVIAIEGGVEFKERLVKLKSAWSEAAKLSLPLADYLAQRGEPLPDSGLMPSEWIHAHLPHPVRKALARFAFTAPYAELLGEARYVERYRSEFATLKYPPSFNTVDAVVVQSGHLLLVRRGAMPGKGQIALPGGFIDPGEVALDACIRELREEARLKVPEPVIRGSLTGHDFFDDPHRSVRGRTFTMAFRFDLKAERELPKVKGGDDAKEAFWLPLGHLDPQQMFEDHYFIVQKMLGI